jgi:hypothetical protein
MEEEYQGEEGQEGQEVDAFRKAIAKRILLESDRLVDELFAVAYDDEVDAKVRLSAISMLIDRGIPKLGIQHSKEEESEEKGSRKAVREEIEQLLFKTEDPDDEPEQGSSK